MLSNLKLTSIQLLNHPNTRIFFILGTLLLAALTGGAPHKGGSGG
jgi:hypothetical protein